MEVIEMLNSEEIKKRANILAEIIVKFEPTLTKTKLLSNIDLMQQKSSSNEVKAMYMKIFNSSRQSTNYFINNILSSVYCQIDLAERAKIREFLVKRNKVLDQKDVEACLLFINLDRQIPMPKQIVQTIVNSINYKIRQGVKKPKIGIMECDSGSRELLDVDTELNQIINKTKKVNTKQKINEDDEIFMNNLVKQLQ